ncbi:unnamed protein product [Discula destructiva]
MNRLTFLLLLLGACVSLVAAASAPTFCKCTCFTNSTIIEIKPTTSGPGIGSHLAEPPSSSPPTVDDDDDDDDDEAELVDDTSIFLTPPSSSSSSSSSGNEDTTNLPLRLAPRAPKRAAASSPTCSQCNRAFCLAQSLPICKGAEEKDVVTMCFQRDSRKDMIIVWGFILGTAGLLGWAGLRKVIEMRDASGAGGIAGAMLGNRRAAVPVGRVGGGNGGRRSAGLVGGGGVSSGSDGARGQYTSVAGHSREGSEL